jgi:hypothetical protein
VHDDAGARLDHRGQQPPVEAYGGEQIHIELVLPLFVAQRGESAGARV